MYDQSGNGNHGTQTNAVYRPYINPAVKRGSMVPVSFVGQYMDIPSAVTLQRTALTHVELTESSSIYKWARMCNMDLDLIRCLCLSRTEDLQNTQVRANLVESAYIAKRADHEDVSNRDQAHRRSRNFCVRLKRCDVWWIHWQYRFDC